ncbi:hypothetical protein HBI55_121020 [Parastagonospora nodorum]|nr:hypothetical protein HBI09_132530 [Parastagonospora nodorum]KAH4198102.1 hypothetical protein HBI95_184470 [Parastagonospora nodorum]KAH5001504.1 hypothetical protein HBI77_145580 [Parastagonospora nodorum]KAH5111913.1 hypothetical protein HBH71_166200 [Parastagonospora nodorum]KAH6115603.1 hypothetical protein HBI69_116140 [Parastagonospora nodorum]
MFHPAMKKEDIESSVAPLLEAGGGSKASYDVASHSRGTQSHFKDNASHLGSIYPSRMFHFIAEDELGQSLMKDELGATTDVASKAVGLQVKAWIYNCNEHHENCMKASKTTWVPTRLLDLVFGDESSIRLVNAKEEGVQGPYVTLSHCWGPNPKFLTTTREREKLHMTKGIKISDLKSTNFEEAISVARHLGIRYIWIDSLCIIQGLNGDFQAEGQLMHKVYRNSYCNLAAADSKDSHGGLFRKRQSSDVLPGGYEGDGSSPIFGTTAWRIMPDNLWDAELLDTEIYKRGWVFQERMLSPRILHFARNQIFWDCGAISACETLPSGLPLMLDDAASTDRHWRGRLQESSSLVHAPLAGVNTDSLGEFWSSAVLSYTQCDLTDQVDKTRAIWSIAKLVRDAWGDDYGVGTWALAVEEQLNWTVINIKTTVRSVDLQWRLPSWSWMSIQGAVSVPKRVLDDRCYRVKGHDEKDIRFVIKGAAKPVFGRIPSDSIKKDMQLGWDKWQKETTRRLNSSSGARANPTQERSQSAPVVPKQDIGIANKSVKDEPAAVADPRDLEPELISNSIKIKAPITPGTLYYDDETGNYNILAKSYDGSKLGETFASNEDNLVGKADSSASAPSVILFMAYPDVTPSSFDLAPNYSHVIILRAKSHTIQKASSGLGIGFEEQAYGSDNEPELPISYSGTGIIVTPTVDYCRQYNHFADDITHLEKKITSLKEDWKIENSKKDLEGLKAWIEDLGREGHWRRTGMVEFKDWSEKDWESVMGRQIWDVMRAQSSPREENDGGEAVYPMGWGTEFWLD